MESVSLATLLAQTREVGPVLISLIVIEGLLSVDNALAIAGMAAHLPERQRYAALRLGIIGAYAFRGLALLFATFIIEHAWLKIVGAAYLVHLMASHFSKAAEADEDATEGSAEALNGRGFWMTVCSIELMDLSLSVDNVVAAVAMSPKFWVVCTGVFIGIFVLRFVAGFCIKLMEKLPILEEAAFLLIGYVGCILLAEITLHWEVSSLEKFAGISLILALTVAYSQIRVVQRVCSPVLAAGRLPLRAYAAVSGGVVAVCGAIFGFLVAKPLRWVWRVMVGSLNLRK